MTDFQTGLLLFAVGFPAVFSILYLIILMGKGLVLFVNSYFPEKEIQEKELIPAVAISKSKVSAIAAAVHHVTAAKGRVTKIEKV